MQMLTVSLHGDKEKTVTKSDSQSNDLRSQLKNRGRKVEVSMVRSKSGEDLRSKLNQKKGESEAMKSRWDDEEELDLDSSYEDIRKVKDKENDKYDRKRDLKISSSKTQRSGRRSVSRSRRKRGRSYTRSRSRSASRSKTRREKVRRKSKSRSHSRTSRHRRPLSEKVSSKSVKTKERGDKSPERKKESSDLSTPKKAKQKRKSRSPSEITEKAEKKKKKNKSEGEEKVKKKKKKAKDKAKSKDKSKAKEKKGDDKQEDKTETKPATEEKETVNHQSPEKLIQEELESDPKGRKSRVDSGISTGSVGQYRPAAEKKEEQAEPVRRDSKVSDSPLSGQSLSLSPLESPAESKAERKCESNLENGDYSAEDVFKTEATDRRSEEKSRSHRREKSYDRSRREASKDRDYVRDNQRNRDGRRREADRDRYNADHDGKGRSYRTDRKGYRDRDDRDYYSRDRRGRDSRSRNYDRHDTEHRRRERSYEKRGKKSPEKRVSSPKPVDSSSSANEKLCVEAKSNPNEICERKEEEVPAKTDLPKQPETTEGETGGGYERFYPLGGEVTGEAGLALIDPIKPRRERSRTATRDERDEHNRHSPDVHRSLKPSDRRTRSPERADRRTRSSDRFDRRSRSPRLLDRRSRSPEKKDRPKRSLDRTDRGSKSPQRAGGKSPDRSDRRTRSPDRPRDRPYQRRERWGSRERRELSKGRRDRSKERRDRSRDRRPYRDGRDADYRRYRRYSPVFNRGSRFDDRYDKYPRRFSSDLRDELLRDCNNSWEDKVNDFMSKIGVVPSNLAEVPRDKSSVASFDPSRPPPSANLVPEHRSDYSDAAFPVLGDVNGGEYTGSTYASAEYHEPTITKAPRYSPDPTNVEIHTAISVDETTERNSKEREQKPLTTKEKKKLEIASREIWQYVAGRLVEDPIFLRRRKKRAGSEEDGEDFKERAEKTVVRIAEKLEKGGFKEPRLWKILKDNEKGVDGFIDEMKVHLVEGFIKIDKDSKKVKEKLDAELLTSGAVFRYIGEFVRDSLSGKSRRESTHSTTSLENVPTNVLQSILHNARSLPQPLVEDPLVQKEGESPHDFAVRSFQDLEKFMSVQLMQSIDLSVEKARDTASLYAQVLVKADYNILSLEDSIRNYTPAEPEFEGEPAQTVYGYLLETLRDIPFEKYPWQLSESGLDTHQTNIVRICLEYFTQAPKPKSPSPKPSLRTVGEEEDGFIGPLPPTETVPIGGNTVNQMPQRRYVLMSVSVDTVSVDGRLVVWQVSVHIPGLPEDEDPDYECLMLPSAITDKPHILSDLGFTFDQERNMYYHQGTEFGRRKAESEEISLEKFVNYLDEIRGGLKGAGKNNGLVLLFETGEDLALVQQLFAKHSHDVFFDVVKGLSCLDHYLRVSRAGRPASYTWPTYQYKVGEGGKWTANIINSSTAKKIEAITKPECIYNICEGLVGSPPTYLNFTKWFSYPVLHPEISSMTSTLEHILELLPLQNFIDRQLFTNRVEITLEGIFSARSEVEATRPHNACARQTIRRLVALGFTLDVLKKSFRSDPNYEIPSSVFLQDMTEVQKLRVHQQTDQVRHFIKQFFVRH